MSKATDCALCNTPHDHMSRVKTWKNIKACEFVAEKGITGDNHICRLCRDDVGRVLTNSPIILGGKNKGLIMNAVLGVVQTMYLHG